MKKIKLLFLTALVAQTVSSQFSLTLVMNPRPIPNIIDWSGRKDVLTLIATPGPVGGGGSVKINTTINTSDGTPVATTDMLKAPVKQMNQGSATIFYANDVVNLQALVFSSSYQNKLNSTGKLPSGSYQITVRLDSSGLPIPLSNTQSKIFFLASTQLPIPILPADGAVLDSKVAQTAITFRWTPIAPRPTESIHYRVQVFEIMNGQQPIQAMRSNQPLLDKEVVNTTQFIWQPQLSFIDSASRKFVWTIQSYDSQKQIILGDVPNGEGRSEAKVFMIGVGNSQERLKMRGNK